MEQQSLNVREHIKPLFIADTIFTIGIVALILLWMFADDQQFMGGFFYQQKSLVMGIGLGLTIAGGILLANAVRKLVIARRRSG